MPGLLDILTQATSGAPSGILGNLSAQQSPNQRVADAFAQLPPEVLQGILGAMPQQAAGGAPQTSPMPTQLPPGLAQLLLGMMSPQGQEIPPTNGQAPQMTPMMYGQGR